MHRYHALVGAEPAHQGDDLAEVLRVLLAEIIDDNTAEDVAVWDGPKLAAVIVGRDVTVFPLGPIPTPPASAAALAS